MQHYRYTFGDRPLEGYTIQRAIGRGGFGEVYYALSDSGREVALKAICGYEQIELRGVRQCMNLKSPHLVTIFDIKQNDQGRSFVLMEYVSGPSLRDLLNQAPGGLGVQKAAFLLREIAKGLTYLHDAGVVHRDLKPGNIFYDAGYVKIGDYGLSKAITPSRHEGQTITVGTVHYMAPEIGAGCYDRGIDIYALGVILYEMLTGRVPYDGASHGEILMKHVAAEPDLTGLDATMAKAVARAMTKDPARRFPTVQAMAEAVFGCENIRTNVSAFRPESLSFVAEAAAADGGTGAKAKARVSTSTQERPRAEAKVEFKNSIAGAVREAVLNGVRDTVKNGVRADVSIHTSTDRRPRTRPGRVNPHIGAADRAVDPLTGAQRFILAAVTLMIVAMGTALVSSQPLDQGRPIVFVTLMIAGASAGLLAAWRTLRMEGESGVHVRLVFGAVAGCAGCAALAIPVGVHWFGPRIDIRATLLSVVAAMVLVDWRDRMAPGRWQRVQLTPALNAGLVGWLSSLILDGSMELVIGATAGLSLVIQALSPMRSRAERPAAEPDGAGRATPPPPPPTEAGAPSPYSRAWALGLSLLWCLPGLQRFYVGKFVTGALWLLTGGLLGVGQAIDVVFILTGQFRDSHGRPIDQWNGDRPGGAVAECFGPEPSPARRRPKGRRTNTILSILAIGGLLAVVTPFAFMQARGVWFGRAAVLAAVAPGAAALLLLIFARRRGGASHIARGVAGAVGLLLATAAAWPFARIPWRDVANCCRAHRIQAALSLIEANIPGETILTVGALLFASTILLAWPAPKSPAAAERSVQA